VVEHIEPTPEYRLEVTEDPERPGAIFRLDASVPTFTFGPNDQGLAQKILANLNNPPRHV
jgi:hypothetical protein